MGDQVELLSLPGHTELFLLWVPRLFMLARRWPFVAEGS